MGDFEAHRITLSDADVDFLRRKLSSSPGLAEHLESLFDRSAARPAIVARRNEIEEIRDFLSTLVAIEGFSDDYTLNDTGRIAEDLIDKLFLP